MKYLINIIIALLLVSCGESTKDRDKSNNAEINKKDKNSMFCTNLNNDNTFSDKRDGKVYKIVKIGNQVWMAENLAYKAKKGCWAYDNDQTNVTKYGYLYNYKTAKKVCPDGYHLPTKEEFEILLKNYDGETRSKNSRARYKALILNGNSGFSALLGGSRRSKGHSVGKGKFGNYWSVSDYSDLDFPYYKIFTDSWMLYVNGNGHGVIQSHCKQTLGFSVRCVQDK